MEQEQKSGGFRVFLCIWFGQTISLVGTGFTGFAMGIWVYQTTGSVTQFGLVVASAALPGLLLSPFFGAIVDRWDRRQAMIWSDFGAALRTVALVLLLTWDGLEVWHVFIAAAVRSICEGLQYPAYFASISMLVPKEQLGRANGLVGLSQSAAQVLAPAAAGLLIPIIGIRGVLGLDIVTFAIALAMLLLVRIPRPEATGPAGEKKSLLRDTTYGWHYIRGHRGLLSLLAFIVLVSFLMGFGLVLITPLVLSFGSEAQLGFVLSAGGIGALLGGSMMSAWGGPKRRVYSILGFSVFLGLGLLIVGFRPDVVLVAGGLAVTYFSIPIINACNMTIWQSLVEPAAQGRVLGTMRLIAQITMPLAFVLAGPLADRVFVPLLEVGGRLADSVGPYLGVGDGRGIGLLFVTMGALLLATTVLSFFVPSLHRLQASLEEPTKESYSS